MCGYVSNIACCCLFPLVNRQYLLISTDICRSTPNSICRMTTGSQLNDGLKKSTLIYMRVADLQQSEPACSSRIYRQIWRYTCIVRIASNESCPPSLKMGFLRIFKVVFCWLSGVVDSILKFHSKNNGCVPFFCMFWVRAPSRFHKRRLYIRWSLNFSNSFSKQMLSRYVQLIRISSMSFLMFNSSSNYEYFWYF